MDSLYWLVEFNLIRISRMENKQPQDVIAFRSGWTRHVGTEIKDTDSELIKH